MNKTGHFSKIVLRSSCQSVFAERQVSEVSTQGNRKREHIAYRIPVHIQVFQLSEEADFGGDTSRKRTNLRQNYLNNGPIENWIRCCSGRQAPDAIEVAPIWFSLKGHTRDFPRIRWVISKGKWVRSVHKTCLIRYCPFCIHLLIAWHYRQRRVSTHAATLKMRLA